MALTYRTSVAAGNVTSGTNPSVAITPANGDLFLVFCAANGNTNAAPTCSDGNTGGTYTLIGTALKNTSADIISCFVRNALVPNTTSTTVTVAIGAHTATEIVVVAVSGAVGAGIGTVLQSAFQANQAGSTTPAPTLAGNAKAQSLLLSLIGNGTNPGGVAVTAGSAPTWTRDQNVGQTVCGLCVEHTNSGFSGTVVTWGGTSASAFASGALEIGITPATTGVNVSKLVGYAVLAPMPGVNVTKLVGYAVLANANVSPPVWGAITFPDGMVARAYDQSWDMPTAAETVTYSVLSGALPDGLALAAVSHNVAHISGTPTTAGTSSFTLRAVNVGGTADKALSITIDPLSGGPSAHGWAY